MSTSHEEANKAVVSRVLSTWNKQDTEGLVDRHTEDVVLHGEDADIERQEDLLTAQ